MPEFPQCRRTDWAEVEGWADRIDAQIRERDHIPDALVGLTRGGWVPARLLADRLGIKRIISLRLQHWGVTATPSGKAELTEGLSAPVAGLKVLIVDDITDTGESLELATRHVTQSGAARVESATCLHIAHSKFVPTYFAEEIPRDQWVWVVFPWNYWEDLTTLAGRAAEADPELSAIAHTLKERCGLSIPVEDLRRLAHRRSEGA
ncbi:MAG: phosphoribosyltransferase [Thermoplasmata archaeon]